jgi:hypothetical protein
MKNNLLVVLAIASISLVSCSNKEVQANCRCCGGFSGGCWDEAIVTGKDTEQARERCVAKASPGADFNCDLN